jgi:hypothetical protein
MYTRDKKTSVQPLAPRQAAAHSNDLIEKSFSLITKTIFYKLKFMTRQLLQKFLNLILLLSILAVFLPAAAQTRRTATPNQPKLTGATCTGAWSGIVKYRRDFEDTFNENATNKSYSGAYKKVNRTQSKQVTGRIVLDGKIPAGVPAGFAMNVGGTMMGATAQTGRANVTFTETLDETNQTAYTDSCGWETREKKCQGSTKQHGVSMTETDYEQFMLEFQGDSYGFSFRLPGESGTLEKIVKQTCTGRCKQKGKSQTSVLGFCLLTFIFLLVLPGFARLSFGFDFLRTLQIAAERAAEESEKQNRRSRQHDTDNYQNPNRAAVSLRRVFAHNRVFAADIYRLFCHKVSPRQTFTSNL